MTDRKMLIFRTIAVTSMVFVVRDVIEKFGERIQLCIIARPENANSMKEISGVKNVISYSRSAFVFREVTPQQFVHLNKNEFDLVIVPVNGNLESYDNVIDFSLRIFGNVPIYYYVFPKRFVRYHFNLLNETVKRTVKILSTIAAVPMLFLYILGILLYSLRAHSKPS